MLMILKQMSFKSATVKAYFIDFTRLIVDLS
jgi:hypothetical protein